MTHRILMALALLLFMAMPSSPVQAALEPQASEKLKNRAVREFQAETLDGKKFSFSSIRGKPTIINFFTSWCPVCGFQNEDLVKLAPEFSAQGIQVYGILADAVETPDTVAEAIKTLSAQPLPYPVLLMNASMKTIFSYEGFPATYFIDKNGKFSTTLFGHVPLDQMRFTASLIASEKPLKLPDSAQSPAPVASEAHHWPWEKNAIQAFVPTEWKAWHPLFVHFPIVLLLLESIFVALALSRKDRNTIMFSRWILVLATLSLMPVLFSGFHDSGFNLGPGSQTWNGVKDRYAHFWRLESTVSLHFLLALALLAVTGIRLLWRSLAGEQLLRGKQKFAFASLTLLGLWILFAAGQVGGGISHS